MKTVNSIKAVVLTLLLLLSQNLFANSSNNFILNHDDLVDKRAVEKIQNIGAEVKSKLGINIHLYTIKSLGLDESLSKKEKFNAIKKHEQQILSTLDKPYVLLTAFIEDTHVNLLTSSSLKGVLDKDDILDGYVVPLLASKDKNTLFAKVSASMLNGYAAVADKLANKKNIELETSIGSQGKVSGTIWRVFMYTLVVVGLLLYTYAVLKNRKK
ncbi:MAG: hypothetical protein ACQERD_10105 [Campylobacterota bacterium]